MAITSETKFSLHYLSGSALPTSNLVVGGLYFWQGNIYLATSATDLAQLGPVTLAATLPASGIDGRLYIDTTNNILKYWNGSEFVAVGGDTVTTLATARGISITGGATAAAVDFDGSADIALEVTELDASKLSGAIPATITVGTTASPVASESYVTSAINEKLTSVMHYKGTVAATTDLPTADMVVGDVYNVTADGSNWAYTTDANAAGNGSIEVRDAEETVIGYWEKLGAVSDLSGYVTKADDQTISGNITFSNKITGTIDAADTATSVTGTIGADVTATTQTAGDNSTKVATTAYVDAAVASGALTWIKYD